VVPQYLLRTWVLLRLDANKHPGQAWISGQEKRLGMPSCSWDLGLGTKSRDRSVAPASVLRLEEKGGGGVGEEGNFPHSQGSRLRNHNPAAACGLAHPSEPRPADLARMGWWFVQRWGLMQKRSFFFPFLCKSGPFGFFFLNPITAESAPVWRLSVVYSSYLLPYRRKRRTWRI